MSTTEPRKQTRRLRKPRSIQACNYCRLKKYKCDGKPPCSLCRRHKQQCAFRSVNGATIVAVDEPNSSSHTYKVLEQKLALAEAALRINGISTDLGGDDDWSNYLALESFQDPWDDSDESKPKKEADRHGEILEFNKRTSEFEFHGHTSYMTFLDEARKMYLPEIRAPVTSKRGITINTGKPNTAVLDLLHNNSFFQCRMTLSPNKHRGIPDFSAFPACLFLESYFNTVHFLHPIVFEAAVREIARQLWQNGSTPFLQPFDALYFAILSIGALTHNWDEGLIGGMGRFEWSRLFFSQAEAAIGCPGPQNNIAIVQATYIMAKVCQFELNLPLAYSFLGIATRMALSLGLNRNLNPHTEGRTAERRHRIDSQTWWAVYSFEVELSFALGRPDTLGPDGYHNRILQPIGDTEESIISLMLPLARMIRKVSPSLYFDGVTITEKLQRTVGLEQEMQNWLEDVPYRFQPLLGRWTESESCLFGAPWVRMQKFALAFRYLHLRLVVYHPFLLYASKHGHSEVISPALLEAAEKCNESAIHMVELMSWAFSAHKFVRWWWDNVVYLTFALSALLLEASKPGATLDSRITSLKHIEQCVLLFDAMNDCDVSRNLRDLAQESVHQLKIQTSQALLTR